jgi:hypothetical protein
MANAKLAVDDPEEAQATLHLLTFPRTCFFSRLLPKIPFGFQFFCPDWNLFFGSKPVVIGIPVRW